MKVPTGVRRLDELLRGGMPRGSFGMVYGPPFIGKELLARQFFLQGRRQGIPSVYLVTNRTSADLRRELNELDPQYPAMEEAGLAWFIDTYSRPVGAEEDHKFTEYVDGPLNLNAISLALNNIERRIVTRHADHRLVVDSVSTLVAHINAQTAFRFLQVFLGKARRAGATGLFILDDGMHGSSEVQMFKHLADGVCEFRSAQGKNQMQATGLGLQTAPTWVEYMLGDGGLEITGSFAAGRIR